jgi:hypothetical protein
MRRQSIVLIAAYFVWGIVFRLLHETTVAQNLSPEKFPFTSPNATSKNFVTSTFDLFGSKQNFIKNVGQYGRIISDHTFGDARNFNNQSAFNCYNY